MFNPSGEKTAAEAPKSTPVKTEAVAEVVLASDSEARCQMLYRWIQLFWMHLLKF